MNIPGGEKENTSDWLSSRDLRLNLVAELKIKQLEVNCQTCVLSCLLSCLLYADDIVLLAQLAKTLQGLINVVGE